MLIARKIPDIILTTLKAKYAHCAFGRRHRMANLGNPQPRTSQAIDSTAPSRGDRSLVIFASGAPVPP